MAIKAIGAVTFECGPDVGAPSASDYIDINGRLRTGDWFGAAV